MHVHTLTPLSCEEIERRFIAVKDGAAMRRLDFVQDRTPPKLFLAGAPVTLPAAAELMIEDGGERRDVILRLMWGPLPAPFPRCLAAVGLLAGALILTLGGLAAPALIGAGLAGLLPLAALLYQRRGEAELQRRLGEALDRAAFEPRPH